MATPFLHAWTNARGTVGRRDFLKQLTVGSAAATTIGWRDLLIANADELRKKQRAMILLWMDGGPSQFESFNPKPGSKNQGPAQGDLDEATRYPVRRVLAAGRPGR